MATSTKSQRPSRRHANRRKQRLTRKKNAIHLIDCDVHHGTEKIDDLYPYLSKQYVEYVKDFGSMMPGVEESRPIRRTPSTGVAV